MITGAASLSSVPSSIPPASDCCGFVTVNLQFHARSSFRVSLYYYIPNRKQRFVYRSLYGGNRGWTGSRRKSSAAREYLRRCTRRGWPQFFVDSRLEHSCRGAASSLGSSSSHRRRRIAPAYLDYSHWIIPPPTTGLIAVLA